MGNHITEHLLEMTGSGLRQYSEVNEPACEAAGRDEKDLNI